MVGGHNGKTHQDKIYKFEVADNGWTLMGSRLKEGRSHAAVMIVEMSMFN